MELKKLFSWYKPDTIITTNNGNNDTEQQENEEQQRELLNQLSALHNAALVSETDLQGNIIFANDTFCEIAKFSRAELMGQNHRILKSGRQPQAIFENLWKTISTGNVWRGEVMNKAKDGSFYWVFATITPALDNNGKPYKYISVRFDLTQQKAHEETIAQANEELAAQDEELRQNLEEMESINEDLHNTQIELIGRQNALNNAAICSETNLAGDITFVNDTFCKISKYSREELMGQNHRILKSGKQPDSLFVELWKTISSGNYFQGEVLNRAKDGTFYWVLATITPVLGSDGKPVKYIGVRFEITKIKEHEIQLAQQFEEIETQFEELSAQEEEMRQQMQHIQKLNGDLNQAKTLLEQKVVSKEGELADSVTYSQRIQRAMITPINQVNELTLPSFKVGVLYKPKDKVGGDFYWAGRWKNKTVLAMGDGSGHGVPGAFMSIVGISLLAKLVEDRGMTEPASLLDELDSEVKRMLNQENELTDHIQDSLEMSILSFVADKSRVTFGSAMRPALFAHNGTISQINGDKRPIGGTLYESTPFNNQSIDFELNDSLYLFSDGFAHQMGGQESGGKKLGMSAFREILAKISVLEKVDDQVAALNRVFEDWRGFFQEQTDDIIIVIVKKVA